MSGKSIFLALGICVAMVCCALSASAGEDGIFEVRIAADIPVGSLVAEGKYDYVNPDLPLLSPAPDVTEKLCVRFMQVTKKTSYDEALMAIKALGARPATFAELLVFGGRYPEAQKEGLIAALGTKWWGIRGGESLAYLGADARGRFVDVTLAKSGFDVGWRLLMVVPPVGAGSATEGAAGFEFEVDYDLPRDEALALGGFAGGLQVVNGWNMPLDDPRAPSHERQKGKKKLIAKIVGVPASELATLMRAGWRPMTLREFAAFMGASPTKPYGRTILILPTVIKNVGGLRDWMFGYVPDRIGVVYGMVGSPRRLSVVGDMMFSWSCDVPIVCDAVKDSAEEDK